MARRLTGSPARSAPAARAAASSGCWPGWAWAGCWPASTPPPPPRSPTSACAVASNSTAASTGTPNAASTRARTATATVVASGAASAWQPAPSASRTATAAPPTASTTTAPTRCSSAARAAAPRPAAHRPGAAPGIGVAVGPSPATTAAARATQTSAMRRATAAHRTATASTVARMAVARGNLRRVPLWPDLQPGKRTVPGRNGLQRAKLPNRLRRHRWPVPDRPQPHRLRDRRGGVYRLPQRAAERHRDLRQRHVRLHLRLPGVRQRLLPQQPELRHRERLLHVCR